VYANESKDRQALSEHIKVLTNLNQQVSQETNNLTRALKGGNKVQGNWGEMILERALELSGLKNGVEYEKQVWGIDEDGKGTRPDVVVHLPEGRDVVVDSKVTLVAYEESVSAETDEAREGALDRHCDAVIGHVNDLHSKSYEAHGKVKTLDYVLMFMPIEAAFVAAITRRPSLFEEAYKKRIILVSPSTLLVSLRTIQNMWQSEYHNRNAQEIAEKAAGLYDKFAGFVETLSKVKKAIESAAGECDAAMGQLSTGGGSLARKIEYFRSLGIKPRKSLPSSMLRASGETDDDDPIDAKSPDYP
jgi:DNA recombination protein RmuC